MKDYEKQIARELRNREQPPPPLPEELRRRFFPVPYPRSPRRSPILGPLVAAAAVFSLFFWGIGTSQTQELGSQGLKTLTALSREVGASPALCGLKSYWNLPCGEKEGPSQPSKGDAL